MAGRADRLAGVRHGRRRAGAGADHGLGAGHAALGQGRERRAQGRTAEEPAALPQERARASVNGRGLRAGDLARPAACRNQPGRPCREVRRRAGLGAVPRLPRGPRRESDGGRLDRRCLRLRLGRLAAFHRAAVGPCRPLLAQRSRHVDLRRRRGDGRARLRHLLVVGLGRGGGLRNGAPLPEPFGGRRGHHAARLARLSHRHLPLLARSRLRDRRARPRPCREPDRSGGSGLLVRAISMFVSGAVLFWLGEKTHPRLNPARKGEPA